MNNIINTIKNVLGSKTVWGLIIAAIPTVANAFGYSVSSGFTEEATGTLDIASQIVGLAIALYGRVVATKALIHKEE